MKFLFGIHSCCSTRAKSFYIFWIIGSDFSIDSMIVFDFSSILHEIVYIKNLCFFRFFLQFFVFFFYLLFSFFNFLCFFLYFLGLIHFFRYILSFGAISFLMHVKYDRSFFSIHCNNIQTWTLTIKIAHIFSVNAFKKSPKTKQFKNFYCDYDNSDVLPLKKAKNRKWFKSL